MGCNVGNIQERLIASTNDGEHDMKRDDITMLKLENVEDCGGEPEQAANMHMNRLSFMLKWSVIAFMSVVYVQPLPEAISTRHV